MFAMITVLQDLQEEIEYFFNDLNWTYILIFVFVLYGIKYKMEFNWYNKMFNKNSIINSLKSWIAGIIVAIFFSFFKYLEGDISPSYVSGILRSWIVVIVFNSIFSDKISKIEKREKNKK